MPAMETVPPPLAKSTETMAAATTVPCTEAAACCGHGSLQLGSAASSCRRVGAGAGAGAPAQRHSAEHIRLPWVTRGLQAEVLKPTTNNFT